jgi:hypothetical protein
MVSDGISSAALRTARCFAGVAATVLVLGGTASAAQSVVPVRTLVYDWTSSRHCSPGDDFGDERGTLTMGIVSTSAQELVADVTFKTESFSQPTFRVAMTPDGSLSINRIPGTWYDWGSLCPTVRWLFPQLAAGFLTSSRIAAGQSWQIGDLGYHVDNIAGDRAVIAISSWVGARESKALEGKMTFSTDARSPITLDLNTLYGYVTANLVSDTAERR